MNDEGRSAVRAAALLCKDNAFQRWMLGGSYLPGDHEANEGATIAEVRLLLGVKSRAEIGADQEKLLEWRSLCRRFEQARRGNVPAGR